MSDIVSYSKHNKVVRLKATPQRPFRKDERTNWQKFVAFILPWLNDKEKLGERLLNAKVALAEAQVFKTLAEGEKAHAEAEKTRAEARKIAAEAATIEAANFLEITPEGITMSAAAKQLQVIEDKYAKLLQQHGVKVHAELVEE